MFPIVVVVLALVFQIYVTWRVWRDAVYTRAEKWAQSRLVWLLPLLGAAIVFVVMLDETKHDRDH
jgi:hypothetical protein